MRIFLLIKEFIADIFAASSELLERKNFGTAILLWVSTAIGLAVLITMLWFLVVVLLLFKEEIGSWILA